MLSPTGMVTDARNSVLKAFETVVSKCCMYSATKRPTHGSKRDATLFLS
ncbi:hypothetical protein SAMN05444414_102203 [Roseovarius marisflavi]|uniref:Uncharacterized protein n=1 Tax=Roseovarius marisflavi TaxID=1054996 RepID=A0A1M6WA34_9RHOB|nr:hypothetical protein SAMN05444414_102203 [Roseovarius marisflavi]